MKKRLFIELCAYSAFNIIFFSLLAQTAAYLEILSNPDLLDSFTRKFPAELREEIYNNLDNGIAADILFDQAIWFPFLTPFYFAVSATWFYRFSSFLPRPPKLLVFATAPIKLWLFSFIFILGAVITSLDWYSSASTIVFTSDEDVIESGIIAIIVISSLSTILIFASFFSIANVGNYLIVFILLGGVVTSLLNDHHFSIYADMLLRPTSAFLRN